MIYLEHNRVPKHISESTGARIVAGAQNHHLSTARLHEVAEVVVDDSCTELQPCGQPKQRRPTKEGTPRERKQPKECGHHFDSPGVEREAIRIVD